MIKYQEREYFDDRLFILYLCKGKVEIQPDGLVSTTIYHEKELTDFVWCLVTFRNCARYPATRVDSFYKKEDAITYQKSIEPETPLISLQGKSPINPLSYEEYRSWKNKNDFKEYDFHEVFTARPKGSNARETFMEEKSQFKGIR